MVQKLCYLGQVVQVVVTGQCRVYVFDNCFRNSLYLQHGCFLYNFQAGKIDSLLSWMIDLHFHFVHMFFSDRVIIDHFQVVLSLILEN